MERVQFRNGEEDEDDDNNNNSNDLEQQH